MTETTTARNSQGLVFIDTPPYPGWSIRREKKFNAARFWTGYGNNIHRGQAVVQLGTKTPGGWPAQHGYSRNGYHVPDFKRENGGNWSFAVHYSPVSVTDIDTAGVYTVVSVNMALYDNTIKDERYRRVEFDNRLLYSGAPGGTLFFRHDMVAGRSYRFYMYAEVFIWQASNQGYGEAIVDFTKVVSREVISFPDPTQGKTASLPKDEELPIEVVLDQKIEVNKESAALATTSGF